MVSVACCPLRSDDGETASASSTATRRARKEHRCYECREFISPGTRYQYVSGIWDGEPGSFKSCLSCAEIRDHFACNEGFVFGSLWGQLEENFFPDMAAGGPCMEGLSPENKARLIERRMKWYEDSAEERKRIARWFAQRTP